MLPVIQKHLDELLAIVQTADEAIMEIYNANSAKVELKADNTPLTQADMAAHHILTQALTKLFPDVPVVSEEGDVKTNKQIVQGALFWLVDPMDGTREFINRTDEFTVCVALIEDDIPCFGIISAPALKVTYYGGPAMGSYKKLHGQSAQPIRVATRKTNVVLTSRSHPNQQTAEYIRQHFKDAALQQVGSQLKLPLVAEGSADCYPRIGSSMHLWDLAAGHAILQGAGGTVARPNGEALDYHAQSLKIGDFIARA